MKSKFSANTMLVFWLLFSVGTIFGQAIKVTGTVSDDSGEPLIGATVVIKGSTRGVITDYDGHYSIYANEGDVLQCSYVGYQTMTGTVTGSTLDFTLPTDLLNLDEVVVTGTSGLTTKKQLGSSITSVSGKDLNNASSGSVIEALQGRISGAQIMRNSGAPGSSISIRLRGSSTILGSSDPLIMLDGVIINSDPRGVVSLGSYKQNPLSDIDMNDIESIEILKGAAAAARYGSFASNGIINIFTKKGKAGKPRITLATSMNFNSVLKYKPYNTVNKKWQEDPDNPGTFITVPAERYNYQDYIFQNASGYETSVNVSGGNEKTKYSVSGSLTNNDGILKSTNYNRKNLRIRLDQELTKWLTVSVGNYSSFNKTKDIPFANAWTGNPMVALLFADNSVDASPDSLGNYPNLGWMSNPYEDVDRLDIQQNNVRSISDIQLKAFLMDGLTLNYTFGYDHTASNGKFKIPYGFTGDALGDLKKYQSRVGIINSNADAAYQYPIGENLKATTGAGYSYQKKNRESYYIRTDKLPEFENIDVVTGDVTGGNGVTEISYWGGYLQQQFGFRDKLFVTFAGRIDGASTFGVEERQQFYPKVSGSYTLSDEDFWKESLGSVFNTFNIRAAWGQAGNLSALDSRPYGIYSNYGVGSYNGESSYFPSAAYGNPLLKPERQTEMEFGVDMSMFNNRLGLEFSYYKQDITDLLLQRNLSPSTGYGSKFENVGDMTNNGIELALNAVAVNTKDLKWNIRATYSKNTNKVTYVEGGRLSLGGFGTSVALTNQPLGVFYGFYAATDANGKLVLTEDGIPQAALGHYDEKKLDDGQVILTPVQDFDANGQPTGEKLKKVIGDPNPDFLASLTNEVTYKGFIFRLHFDAVQGFDVMDWDKRIAFKYAGGFYAGEELEGKKPKGYYAAQYGIYDRFIEDGSFIKLREVSLGYTLPVNKPYLRSVRFLLSGSNLMTISDYWGYDPEVNFEGASNGSRAQDFGNIPIPRVYKIGATFNF